MVAEERTVLLDDVAQMSGVSRATASRALAGKPGVADDVRERVQLIAKAMNYRPNRAAKNLAGARTSIVGLVLGATNLHYNPYTSHLVDSMAKAADEFDQGLLLVMSQDEPARAVSNLIHDGIVDGVIVSSVIYEEPWALSLLDVNLPLVLIGAHPERPELPTIEVENKSSARQLVGHLIDTGCQRIGMILGPPTRADAADRRAGYESAHQDRGLSFDPDLVVPGDFTRKTGQHAAEILVERGADAVFAANDLSALGAIAACEDLGRSIPDQVSVVGFDGTSQIATDRYDLTTARQPFEFIARRAVERLLEPRPGIEILSATVHLGETSRSAGET